jgi:hypothetical protein
MLSNTMSTTLAIRTEGVRKKSSREGQLAQTAKIARQSNLLESIVDHRNGMCSSHAGTQGITDLLLCVGPNQSILQYNGGAVIAMAGKNCVGICRSAFRLSYIV